MRLNLIAARSLVAALCVLAGAPSIAQQPNIEGPAAVLTSYKSAIERLDVSGVARLFAPDAVVIEFGKVEGVSRLMGTAGISTSTNLAMTQDC